LLFFIKRLLKQQAKVSFKNIEYWGKDLSD